MPIRALLAAGSLVVLAAALAAPVSAQTIVTATSQDPALQLGEVAFAGGKTLTLSQGIGSGAYRRPGAPSNIFVTVSDRGANFTCGDAEDVVGISGKKFCGDVKSGRIYPMPSYSPSVFRVLVEDGSFRLLDTITLKDGAGMPITGLPNTLTHATTENALDAEGGPVARSPAAIDAEGIVELEDGSFWIGEENGPSVLHVAPDGRIQLRIVPKGSEDDFAGAGYPVVGGLPAILIKRQANRGIESMALGADGRSLFFTVQNPLANPDADAYAVARNTRLFRLDRLTGQVVAEHVYELTPMSQFPGEAAEKPSTARISELTAIGPGRFLIDDRTDTTALIFELDLDGATNILGSEWDDAATSPSLEQVSLADAAITPVTKRLVLDSSRHPELPRKIEGMAFFGDGSLMLINDNDFGIEGDDTVISKITGLDLQR